jgi:hypothetical protein
VFLANLPVQNIKKTARIIRTPPFGQGWAMPHEKCHFLLDIGFSRKRDNKPQLKLHMTRLVLLIYVPNEAKYANFWWINYRLWGQWN